MHSTQLLIILSEGAPLLSMKDDVAASDVSEQ